jgi:cysteinyl-tRNA synthetase
MIQLYNSLTQQVEEFTPLQAGQVGLYVCGMTVYDYCHIGHARSLIVFDTIVRYLRYRGFKVNYVRNITDIDDKIIKRANENNETTEQLTERFIAAMHEDEKTLGIDSPDHEPRATEFLPQIISLIEKIIAQGFGYVTDSGDVCFDILKFKDYGKLSKRDVEKLISGARVSVNKDKKSPLDFVLWKLAKPGEPSWSSPWGEGRPGWHIECSAMSTTLLGQPFDIHGGGMDLKFPHHENEIAQSEAGCGCDFARYWLHSGLLNINGEKMSKSLGNFLTIRDALQQYPAEVIRYFMLSGHYRSPINYSTDSMTQMRAALTRLYTSLRGLPAAQPLSESVYKDRFIAAMDDDFNTPQAMAVLFDLSHEINRLRDKDQASAAEHGALLVELAAVLGVGQLSAERFLQGDVSELDTAEIEALIAQRNAARAAKDWALADQLRRQLADKGIMIEDDATGTVWRRR